MLRSVKAELYKLFKNRTFKVLCIVSIFLSLLMAITASPLMEKIISDSLKDMSLEQKEQFIVQISGPASEDSVITPGKLGFQGSLNPTTIQVFHSSFGSGAIEVLIGILVAAMMAKEYSQGTIKNSLAYGRKRMEFYLSKFLALILGVTIILVILTTISTTSAFIMNGWGEPFKFVQILEMARAFLAAVIVNSAVAAIILVIATLVKSNGATIGITVGLFILIPTILSFIYGVYPWFDRIYEVTPFYNSALATSAASSGGDVLRAMVIGLVTIAISLVLGTSVFKTQDIK